MFKGFRAFLAQGNVIDLATAVIIGTAFTAVVTAFTTAVVEPLVSRIGVPKDSDHNVLKIALGGDQFIDLNLVVTAVINFLIIAAVVYFVIILPFKRFGMADQAAGPSDEAVLLAEIRDLLQSDQRGAQGSAQTSATELK